MKKKLLSILVVLAMVVAIMPMTVLAEAEQIGDYTFDKETGTITGYTGAGGALEIPATLDGVNVTAIGGEAFYENSNITSVTFAEGSQLSSIGDSAFYSCRKLESISIPSSVTSIGREAFRYSAINSVTFAEGSQLSSIGNKAFAECNFESITIPASVSSINSQAFYSCSKLKSVTLKSVTPPSDVDGETFSYCHGDLKIYVPAASVDAYKEAAGWSQYADKIVAFHDLKVTKYADGKEVDATLGEDYEWKKNVELHIKKDGLTVSGTTTSEIIKVNSDVSNLTIKDLSISIDSWSSYPFYPASLIQFSSNQMTLTLVGNNILKTTLNKNYGLRFTDNGGIYTIKGEGNLTVNVNNENDESNYAIYSQNSLTFEQTGTIMVSGNKGIVAKDITFKNGIGKILARGDNDKGALYHFGNPGSITFEDELLKKGSTDFEAKETDINSDIEIKNKCAKIGDDVAKSVLIQPIYDVKVSDIKNGKVEVDKEKAAKGETVELTVTPSECYKLASIKVTDADKHEVTVTDNKFEMPASNVTVTAEFKTVEYKMIKGEKQEIDLTDVKDAVFTSEADYSKFKSVMVDDKVVDSKNYNVKSGSTIVTLKADYIKTLKVGKHEIKILSEDGMATAELTIVKTTPKTADANNMLLWIVLALAAICLTTSTVLRVKRTNK